MSRKALPRIAAAALAGLTLGGCAGYRLGNTLPPGIRSVSVPTFENPCGEPGLETIATRAAIQQFQREGALEVAAAGEADWIVRAALTACRSEPLRYRNDNRRAATEYRLRLVADVTLEARRDGKALWKRTLEGETTFTVEGDMTSAKVSALPQAARDLARRIADNVTQPW